MAVIRSFKNIGRRLPTNEDIPGKVFLCPKCNRPDRGNLDPTRILQCSDCLMSATITRARQGFPDWKEKRGPRESGSFKSASEAKAFLRDRAAKKAAHQEEIKPLEV